MGKTYPHAFFVNNSINVFMHIVQVMFALHVAGLIVFHEQIQSFRSVCKLHS